jgi:hypothetical protein
VSLNKSPESKEEDVDMKDLEEDMGDSDESDQEKRQKTLGFLNFPLLYFYFFCFCFFFFCFSFLAFLLRLAHSFLLSSLSRNREAAQLFRQRQKAYLQELEENVTEIAIENSEMKAKAELLRSENKLVRDQLDYLRNIIAEGIAYSVGGPGASPTDPQPPSSFS